MVSRANLVLQFDTWHAQKITGNITPIWDQVADIVGLVQLGGWPDRHEPHEQSAFIEALKTGGYTGWISGEYTPEGDTSKGLGWRV